jgi:hypothetical protein
MKVYLCDDRPESGFHICRIPLYGSQEIELPDEVVIAIEKHEAEDVRIQESLSGLWKEQELNAGAD